MSANANMTPPLRLLILALGGEGGGVFMNWVVAAAREAGYAVQASSVPGVAQRTGATSYYIEIARTNGTQSPPALALVPMPGRVDVVVASELMETARALERGFVSPNLTTLISSSNRVYATAEKLAMTDGRFNSDAIEDAAGSLAKTLHLVDLNALATAHGTFISATMFGALAGSGVLPWPTETSRQVLGDGRGAEANKAGFDAACRAVAADADAAPLDGDVETAPAPSTDLDLAAISTDLAGVVAHGTERTADFQDAAYGALYVSRVKRLAAAADHHDHTVTHALVEASRRLALWMAYEDVARVADLKTRPERFQRIAQEVELKPGQILTVTEYLKPQAEEIAAILPVGMGRWVRRHAAGGGQLPLVGEGRYLKSTSVRGYWMLRIVAALKHIRRRSLRYQEEQAAIEIWLTCMETALRRSTAFAKALAELPRVLKGYSDTQSRGQRAFDAIMSSIVQPALTADRLADAADALRTAITAALSDPDHGKLSDALPAASTDFSNGATKEAAHAG